MERVQLHDEMYGNDDVHCLSGKDAAPGSLEETPLGSALRKVSQLVPTIRSHLCRLGLGGEVLNLRCRFRADGLCCALVLQGSALCLHVEY